MIDLRRVRKLNNLSATEGDVLYWMSRDMRVEDNWAMIFAGILASQYKTNLKVVFTVVPEFLGASWRQFYFMLKGLEEVQRDLKNHGIEFWFVSCKNPVEAVNQIVENQKIGTVVCDFAPLKIGRIWRDGLAAKTKVPVLEVDAHNIVPVWVASPKQEFAARTIRPKITKLLPEFLVPIPTLGSVYTQKPQETFSNLKSDEHYQNESLSSFIRSPKDHLKIDFEILPSEIYQPGLAAAKKIQLSFEHKFEAYDTKRNDPNAGALSDLSPYYHFGQIGCQRVAIDLQDRFGADNPGVLAYLEEMIVRRELSDNFCFYQENYDNYEGLANWAKITLTKHWSDPREYEYTQEQWENSQTHDPLWNAANNEMKVTGKMHGFMRMYWAKKILEWSVSPAEAIRIAIYLNDKYELDGRDPSGYVGVLWSIGGLHDRAWFERPVYGQIRYMNYNGCKNKFDVIKYQNRWLQQIEISNLLI